ncbi:pyrroline-5-carboxylate reductase [Alienimonas californiensis]|uniref:Pyrroline-5-carboxylate reductase n=1 Tax=Alienimonas californiensis TaxID=2527989 RepID=A0A517PCI0_9PLAN|nr:pyrroline-5-carboxylate reductase [Alienimonas californiensis]QDT17056.1 Pyrroline-5-carboxylate reductase [Alienimonas californiensis]
MTNDPTIGFLGCGKMATALAGGLVKTGFAGPERVLGSARSAASRDAFAAGTGEAKTFDATDGGNAQLAAASDVLVLSVKPYQLREMLRATANDRKPEALIVSVAAGVTLETLEAAAGKGARVVRVMPNTPSLVGAGAAGFTRGTHATAEDAAFVRSMLECVGVAEEVSEPLLNAVTAVSGSGPAYGFLFLEALADAGVKAGLPRDTAQRLAAATLRGAAAMVEETGEHPAVLKDRVCSPGGTTIAAVAALEEHGLRRAVHAAVAAAAARSKEMANE